MSQMNPIEFIVSHKEMIVPIHNQCKSQTKRTWEILKQVLPELQQTMKFNTFKQYLSVLTVVAGHLDEREAAEKKVRQQLDNHPKRISGWSVQKANDGYYRCYRKIRNKVYSIYIGKKLNLQKAQDRIREKELILGLDKS